MNVAYLDTLSFAVDNKRSKSSTLNSCRVDPCTWARFHCHRDETCVAWAHDWVGSSSGRSIHNSRYAHKVKEGIVQIYEGKRRKKRNARVCRFAYEIRLESVESYLVSTTLNFWLPSGLWRKEQQEKREGFKRQNRNGSDRIGSPARQSRQWEKDGLTCHDAIFLPWSSP